MTCDHMAELTELRRRLREQTRKLEPGEPYVYSCGHLKPLEGTWCKDCVEDLRRRLNDALAQRDHWQALAEQRISLRQELAEVLRVDDLIGDAQFEAAMAEVRKLEHYVHCPSLAQVEAELRVRQLHDALLPFATATRKWSATERGEHIHAARVALGLEEP